MPHTLTCTRDKLESFVRLQSWFTCWIESCTGGCNLTGVCNPHRAGHAICIYFVMVCPVM